MDAREQRGLVMAALCKLNRAEGDWLVPSQSAAQRIYRVNLEQQTCTCPDHQEAGFKCKHIYAVEFTIKREVGRDGTITETRSFTFTEKTTYKQDWPAYNEAQMSEKARFQTLLAELCRGVAEPKHAKTGRKPTLMRDMVFASAFKVYSTVSSRRFACDLADAHEKGYLTHLMHSVSVCSYLENTAMTPVLNSLIVQSSLPLRAIETTFAPDSTGFSTSRFGRWFDEKYGVTRSGHDWVKAHAMVGTKTNIVTAVKILDRHAGDCPQFAPLVETTAKNFTIREVPADKAYLSHENLELVHRLGGTAYIPFKSNSIAGEAGTLWEKMFFYYQFNREAFARKYHQRSNAETCQRQSKAGINENRCPNHSVLVCYSPLFPSLELDVLWRELTDLQATWSWSPISNLVIASKSSGPARINSGCGRNSTALT